MKTLYVLVSLLAYAFGFVTLNLFMVFAGGWNLAPWWIDAPPTTPVGLALLINSALVVVFGLQHTVMARPGFKRAWTKIIPKPLERSFYCVATGIVILLLVACWQPLPGVVWDLESPALRTALNALQIVGWGTSIAASFMINHFDLFGLQQVFDHLKGRPGPEPSFTTNYLYKVIRHPIQTGVLIGMWSTPYMTVSHLCLSVLMSCYILIGLAFEERDLLAELGDSYAAYRRRVPMLIPGLVGLAKKTDNTQPETA